VTGRVAAARPFVVKSRGGTLFSLADSSCHIRGCCKSSSDHTVESDSSTYQPWPLENPVFSGTGSLGLYWKKGRKIVVVAVVVMQVLQ